ncbi:MAG: hypothetical protein KBD64_03345 [Gammaproteobacteria bacterium]|nr:hypothetical protein [Gammaproteobacteria bacterium]
MGFLYHRKLVTPLDVEGSNEELAIKYYTLAAMQYNRFAIYELGRIYWHKKDLTKAMEHWRAAVEWGCKYSKEALDNITEPPRVYDMYYGDSPESFLEIKRKKDKLRGMA